MVALVAVVTGAARKAEAEVAMAEERVVVSGVAVWAAPADGVVARERKSQSAPSRGRQLAGKELEQDRQPKV